MSKVSKRNILKSGTILGKLPGMKEWRLYDLEVTMTELHIYEGGYDLGASRKHLRSMELDDSDIVGEGKTRPKKNKYQLYLRRVDGKYLFRCDTLRERADWMTQLHRVITGKCQFLLAVPSNTCSRSGSGELDALTDIYSGIRPSIEGEVRRSKALSVSTSTDEGEGYISQSITVNESFKRSSGFAADSGKSQNDSRQFKVSQSEEDRESEELENYKWFWGHMNRSDCERRLHMEGEVGNFVVRINADGNLVFSLWRKKDVLHHYKILQDKGIYRFEKSTVLAEGYRLADLMNNYMKNSGQKTFRPFGGALHLVYHEPRSPPDVDTEILSKTPRAQKEYNEAEAAKAEAEVVGVNQMKSTVGQEMHPKERSSWAELNTGPPPPSSQASPPLPTLQVSGPRSDSTPGQQGKSFEPLDGLCSLTCDVFSTDLAGRLSTKNSCPPPLRQANKSSLPKSEDTLSERDTTKISAKDQLLLSVPSNTGNSRSNGDFSPIMDTFLFDSGVGLSMDRQVRQSRALNFPTRGRKNSSGSAVDFGKSHSDRKQFNVIQSEENGGSEELENYVWFWGHMNRSECERRLHMEGKLGNFVVRINADGSFVLSVWQTNGVHHHAKILQHKGMYYFEKTALQAEAHRLVNLLDIIMKNSANKRIGPFGGALHLVHEPWNLPGKKLQERTGESLDAEQLPADCEAQRQDVQILKEIGRGAWGCVAKGIYQGQEVAVKWPYRAILNARNVQRLRREVRVMAKLRHPNILLFIAAVFDELSERLEEPPLIVTELLEINLRLAYESNRLDTTSKLSIFRDVASALNYLHKHHEIVHRDVSAPNVLLEARPHGTWRAKLSDFGSAYLARVAQTAGEGSIIYSAPEAFLLHAHDPNAVVPSQTTKVDVYSYGVLLCEVITNQQPAPENYQGMLQQVERRWRFMYNLIISCTKPSPEERPRMEGVLNELDEALRHFPDDQQN